MRWLLLWVVALGALLGFFVLVPPWPVALWEANTLAYAICHRWPGHSIAIAGHQLPLCARCSGIYLAGLLAGAILAWRRPRASLFPARPLLGLLVGFVVVMGLDGVNSFASLFPGDWSLYPPHNSLRLITGSLHGITLATLLWLLWNSTVWAAPEAAPVLTGRLLAGLVVAALLVALIVWAEPVWLLWPLVLLSGVALVLFVALFNALIVLIATRREQQAHHWSDLLPTLAVALLLALGELGAINVARLWLESRLGLLPL